MKFPPAAPDDLVADYLQARIARDQALEQFGEAEERLMKQMEADQRKTYKWKAGGLTTTDLRAEVHHVHRRTRAAQGADREGLRQVHQACAGQEADGSGDGCWLGRPGHGEQVRHSEPQKAYLDYRSPSRRQGGRQVKIVDSKDIKTRTRKAPATRMIEELPEGMLIARQVAELFGVNIETIRRLARAKNDDGKPTVHRSEQGSQVG